MVALGKVRGNLMIDLHASSTKLRDRAVRVVAELAHATTSRPATTGSERVEFARRAGEDGEIYVPDKRNGSGSREARYDLTERKTLCSGQYL